MRAREAVRIVTGCAFIAAGVLHFVQPRAYAAIMPPAFPRPDVLVAVSGAAEIAGGAGLLLPQTRTAAAWGLVLLLVAVFPANAYMAQNAAQFAGFAPAWALWARLPLQPALIALVLVAGRGGPAR